MSSYHKISEIEHIAADLSVDKALYSYLGKFDIRATDQLIAEVEVFFEMENYPNKLRRKAFHVAVEIAQNLHKYLSIKNQALVYSTGLFMLHGDKQRVVITSGNYVLQSEIQSIKSRIKLINSLTNDELVYFYRGLLDLGKIDEKGGAGLGFVDIAKKSGSKIDFEFRDLDNEYSFYIFKIIIAN